MLYEEYPPPPALSDAVSSFWRFALRPDHEPAQILHHVPPDGAVGLCWIPGGQAKLVGPRLTSLQVPVRAGAEYWGARFLPGAAGPILNVDVCAIRDQVTPFPAADLNEGRVDVKSIAAIVTRVAAASVWAGRDPVVAELTRRIIDSDGQDSVSKLTDDLGLGYRQVLRRFHQAAGVTPKEFARLRRMRAACLQAVKSARPGWVDVSADAGFSDQAHLVREFQDIYGWPPTLVHEYLRRIEHLQVLDPR